jgi:hypothetical protein
MEVWLNRYSPAPPELPNSWVGGESRMGTFSLWQLNARNFHKNLPALIDGRK